MSSTDSLADVIVIGGGIAGVSIAYELSKAVRVTVLEMESTLAYHTTGRSAALFLETYGGVQVRALTTASRAFLEQPPDFFEPVLMTPRPLLQFAAVGRGHAVEHLHAAALPLVPDVELLNGAQCCEAFPLLRPDVAERGLYEATRQFMLLKIRTAPDRAGVVMIVGHNPAIGELANQLTAAGPKDDRTRMAGAFPTCGLAVLDFSTEHWANVTPHAARLVRFVTPADLELRRA